MIPRVTNMVSDRELAALIARDVFAALDSGSDKCQRLEGKGGRYPAAETKLCGYAESALADVIRHSLTEHRSY